MAVMGIPIMNMIRVVVLTEDTVEFMTNSVRGQMMINDDRC